MRQRLTRLWAAQTGQLRGVALVLAATIFFATMHVMIRHLSRNLHAFEITFFRNFLGLAVLAPAFYLRGLAFGSAILFGCAMIVAEALGRTESSRSLFSN